MSAWTVPADDFTRVVRERDEARAEAEQLHQVIQALTDAMHRVMPHDKVAQLLRDAQG